MGLSIHYSGSLSNPDYLSEIIEEVKDIAEVFKWEYNIYEERFPYLKDTPKYTSK